MKYFALHNSFHRFLYKRWRNACFLCAETAPNHTRMWMLNVHKCSNHLSQVFRRPAFCRNRVRGILPPLFHYPSLVFESHRSHLPEFCHKSFSSRRLRTEENSRKGRLAIKWKCFNILPNVLLRVQHFLIYAWFYAYYSSPRTIEKRCGFSSSTRERGSSSLGFGQSERSIRRINGVH